MKQLRNLGSLACTLGLLAWLQPSAHGTWQSYVDNTLKSEGGISIELIVVAAVFLGMIIALIRIVKQGKSGRINVGWAVLSMLFAALAILSSIIGVSAGTVYTKASGDPAETVTSFFDAIVARDYAAAYSYLNDYSSLGLENPPESENAIPSIFLCRVKPESGSALSKSRGVTETRSAAFELLAILAFSLIPLVTIPPVSLAAATTVPPGHIQKL